MAANTKKILVLGATGMLGNAVLRYFASSPGFDAWGSARSAVPATAARILHERVVSGIHVEDGDSLRGLFERVGPDVVVNCIGLVKQLDAASDPILAISINALLPHHLARLCGARGARLVHVSTDCVFAGTRGMYRESDLPDAQDLYGRSKLLGEVDYPNAVTLRTSIVGHELTGHHGLLGWFLHQKGAVRGFTRAVFSGLSTLELARAMRDFVIPRPELRGLYHVSAQPIAKFDLLKLVAREYGSGVTIEPDEKLVIDRSLDSTHFRAQTGYAPPEWPEIVRAMHAFG